LTSILEKKKKKTKRGRPTKYKQEFNDQAYLVCREGGFTDELLAKLFKTTVTSIKTWKNKYSDFLAAIKKGKEEHDTGNVENALLQSAVGYEHDDVHISNYQGEITITPITKHYPPNATSLIFWLKNRNPDRWRDKREIEGKLTLEDAINELDE